MSVVGDNIRALRTLYGKGHELTQSELAEIAGVTRETVNKWESGAIGNIRTANIERLREHFGLSVDDLRSESAGLAARLHVQADNAASHSLASPTIPLRSIDMLDIEMQATIDRVEVPAALIGKHPHAFAVVVPDDSMLYVLPNGCHAIVDPEVEVVAGSIVLVRSSSAGYTFRRIFRGAAHTMLSTDGLESHDEMIATESLDIAGTVVWFQAPGDLAPS